MLAAGRSNPRALHGRHQAGPARGGRERVQHAHPTRGGWSCIGPGATVGVTGLLGGSAVTPHQAARRCQGPKRWVETTQPPGAMRRKASNTTRGTLERRRTCGFDIIRMAVLAGIAVRFGVATRRSPGVRWTPGVPRALGLFSESASAKMLGRIAPRERGSARRGKPGNDQRKGAELSNRPAAGRRNMPMSQNWATKSTIPRCT